MDKMEFDSRYAAINRKYDMDIEQLNKSRSNELHELENLYRNLNEHRQRSGTAQNVDG